MSSKMLKNGSSSRGKGGKVTGSSTHKQAGTQRLPERWVKATWTENKQLKGDAIPKSWVSRSLWTVWWPPTDWNYKKAIALCWAPPAGYTGWSQFKLTWCSNTFDSLAEAQLIETAADNADTDLSSSCEEDEQTTATMDQDPQQPSLGRGLRYG